MEQGYAGLSFEAVAARAGVNKTTIYRRWPTKVELLGAALVSLRDDDPPPPDTGSLREDLLQVLRHWLIRAVTPERRAIMQSLLLANTEPDMQTIVQRLRVERPAIPDIVFERALQRGELPRGTDVLLIRGVLLGTLHSRITLKRQALEPRYLPALVDLVVAGARAGGAVKR
jgi:AcrR family transcriptional regulator